MPHRSLSELVLYLNQVADRERVKRAKAEVAVLRQLLDLGFDWQEPRVWFTKNGGYGGAVFDFYHEGASVAIEIDDNSHKQRKGRDRRRDSRFAADGITTIRFSNRRALKETEAVIEEIKQEMGR